MYLISNIKNAPDDGPQALLLQLTPGALREMRAAVDAHAALTAQGFAPDEVALTTPLLSTTARVWGPTAPQEYPGALSLQGAGGLLYSAALLRTTDGFPVAGPILGQIRAGLGGVSLTYRDGEALRVAYPVTLEELSDPLMGRAH